MENKNSKEERATPSAKRTKTLEKHQIPHVNKQDINKLLTNPHGEFTRVIHKIPLPEIANHNNALNIYKTNLTNC